jgi:hypothetical protein
LDDCDCDFCELCPCERLALPPLEPPERLEPLEPLALLARLDEERLAVEALRDPLEDERLCGRDLVCAI